MRSHTQPLPRRQRPAWRLAGCPIILACRNRDLGMPSAGHEERAGGPIEKATATPARRLPDACCATRFNLWQIGLQIWCHRPESLTASASADGAPKANPQLRLVEKI